jgi:hypothetical protein
MRPVRLARLDVTFADLALLPVLVSSDERPLVIRVIDADTVTSLAGVGLDWSGSWGVWLDAGQSYSAGLIARDVKTLSTLWEIDHVVVDAPAHAAAYADVVAALLGEGEVTLHNEVANITAAYNRPAPPRPVTVWSVEGDTLRQGERVLHLRGAHGAVSFYEG